MTFRVGHRHAIAKSRFLTAGCTLVVLLTTSCFGGARNIETTIVNFIKGEVVVAASGTLEPAHLSRIASQVSGKVVEIYVADGDRVEKDQLLFRLDPAPYQKAADIARERAQAARSAIAALVAPAGNKGVRPQGSKTNDVISSGRAVTQPVIEVTPPASVTVVSPAVPSSALLAAQEEDARQLISLVQEGMTADFRRRVQPLVAGALAQAREADNEATRAQAAIEETEVRAPMAGVVSFLPIGNVADVNPGGAGSERISAGRVVAAGLPVMAIYDLGEPIARARVPESEIARVKVGQRAIVKLAAFAGKELEATAVRVSLEPGRNELGAIAYSVDLQLTDVNIPGWRPGMTTSVEIIVEEIEKAIELPATALISRGTNDFVYVVVDGTAKAVRVETDRARSGKVLVRSGLDAGDEVVVTKAERVSEGQRIAR